MIDICLCTGRKGIRCDAHHCDLAGPGAPGDRDNCRICWLRLGRRKHRIDPAKPRLAKGQRKG